MGRFKDLTDDDLARAKYTIREYFIVGLLGDIKESAERFNVVMGEHSVVSLDD